MRNFCIFFSVFRFIVVKSQSQSMTWPPGTFVPNTCVCAPTGQCSFGGGGESNDGTGQLEARIMGNGADPNVISGTIDQLCHPISTGIDIAAPNPSTCDFGLERCCPSMGFTCGVRYPAVSSAPKPTKPGQANYGAFPFQVVILTQLNEYIGSGVAIDQFHMLTAAHKLSNVSSQLKIRIGDWDASNNVETFAPIETNITFTIHPNFTIGNLKNNLAIMKAQTAIPLGVFPSISTICLPNTTLSNLRCWTSGWGKDNFGTDGGYQNIIKEVDVPLIDHDTCQTMLRQTRLGQNFVLDPKSFICAGGEVGKDACTGDGGAPLSCFVGDRFYLVGLVAWGIGCGQANSPGVYVNIQNFIHWIQQTTASSTEFQTSVGSRVSTTPALNAATSTSSAIGNRISTTSVPQSSTTFNTSSTTTQNKSAGVTGSTTQSLSTSTTNQTSTVRSSTTVVTTTTTKPVMTTTTTTKPVLTTTTPVVTEEEEEEGEEHETEEEEKEEEEEEEEEEGVEKPGPRQVNSNKNQNPPKLTTPTTTTVKPSTIKPKSTARTTTTKKVNGKRTKPDEKTTKRVNGARSNVKAVEKTTTKEEIKRKVTTKRTPTPKRTTMNAKRTTMKARRTTKNPKLITENNSRTTMESNETKRS